jgi:serine phosphatase RsbU (regulator of sigma subunit)
MGRTGRWASLLLPASRRQAVTGVAVAILVPALVAVAVPHETRRIVLPFTVLLFGIAAAAVVARLLAGAFATLVAVGTLTLVFLPPRGSFAFDRADDAAAVLVLVVAGLASTVALTLAVDRVRQLAAQETRLEHALHEQQALVEQLQRAVLPRRPPTTPRVRLATRYLASGSHTNVGGDWFAIVPLPGDRVGLAIGDVAGHGLDAVAVMAEARFSLRTIAHGDARPAETLARLNASILAFEPDAMITAQYGILDPAAGAWRVASAGHPPPLIRRASGAVDVLRGGGVPIGVLDEPAYAEREHPFGPGDLLLLYTDGLVERRDESIEVGIARLARVLGATGVDVESVCDDVIASMTDDLQADDVAIVAVTFAEEDVR